MSFQSFRNNFSKLAHLGFLESCLYFFSFLYSFLFFNSKVLILFPHSLRNRSSIFFQGKFFAKSNFYAEPFFGASIKFGSNVICNRNFYITSVSSVVIGDNCLFGPNVFISDHDHGDYSNPLTLSSFHEPPFIRDLVSAEVFIGDSVWIGANVCILKGVHIGRNSVIGANSVVTSDLPPYSICAGSPCRVIRSLPADQ